MLVIRITSPTNNKVTWPTADADVIALAETYLAYETELPAAQRLAGVTAAIIQTQTITVQTAGANAKTAEDNRAYQANLLAQALEQVKTKIAQATLTLKTKHFGTEAILEQWGYETTIGKDGKINVRQPKTPAEILPFLTQYLAKENSMNEAEAITQPSLLEMTNLNITLQEAAAAREIAQATREASTDTRGRESRKLLYLLQVACAERVLLTYNGLITNNLESWGFQVVEPVASGGTETPGDPPTP